MRNISSPQALSRLARLARWVRLMCVVAAGTLVLGPLQFWAQPERVAAMARREWQLETLQLDLAARLGGFAACMLPAGLGLWALWQVWQLFGCYGRGELLSLAPARHLHRLGLALVLLAGAQPLADTLVRLALTLGNPVGQRLLALGFSNVHFSYLLFGLVMLALSVVMREAARVADDNAGFV